MNAIDMLIRKHGYITEDCFEDVNKTFYGCIKVVIKDCDGNRYVVKIRDLHTFVEDNSIDIREVFLSSDVFDLLRDAVGNYGDDEDEVIKYVLINQ